MNKYWPTATKFYIHSLGVIVTFLLLGVLILYRAGAHYQSMAEEFWGDDFKPNEYNYDLIIVR